MRVLVFGDSIVYGAWDPEGGWVDRLKRVAHQQTLDSEGENKMQVINLGIGGDSSTKVLKRLKAEIEARSSKSWPFTFVFTFGANDERSTNGKTETSLEEFKHNVTKIIEIAREYTDKILFVGIPPLAKDIVEFKGIEYSDQRIVEYEKVMQAEVQKEDIVFVPVRDLLEAGKQSMYSSDDIHPNELGHQTIFDAVRPKLWEILA